MKKLVQNRRITVSDHMIEEIRKRYFRHFAYEEVLHVNRFATRRGQSNYYGETNKKKIPDGLGTMTYHSGTVVEGEWKNGKIFKEYRKKYRFNIFKA